MHLFCVYSLRRVVRWSVSVCFWCDVIWFQSLTFKRHLLKLIKLCLCLSWCHLFLLCIFSLLINIVCFSFRFHINNSFPLCSLDFSTVLFPAESHRRKWHGFFLNKKSAWNSRNKQKIVMWRTVADINLENDVSESLKWKILELFWESVERRLFRLQMEQNLTLQTQFKKWLKVCD